VDNEREHSISPDVLARFAAGEATPEECRLVGRHLLAGCGTCTQALSLAAFPAGGGEERPPPAGAYDQAFAAVDRDVAAELKRRHPPAQKLLAALDRLPAERQEMRVRNSARYASLELSAAYVERSHDVRYRDADEMLRFARLAVAAAEAAACVGASPRSLINDTLAHAWGQLANTHRVRSEVREAGHAFARGEEFLREGTGEPSLRAWFLEMQASYYRQRRDFQAAVELLAEAVRLHSRLHDRRAEARALISLALVRIVGGQPEEAISPLQRCLPMLTGRPHDLDLLWAATQNLVYCFVELQQPAHAYDLLALSEPQFADCTDELVHLRVAWVKGKVERELGLYGAAQFRLEQVRDTYMRKDLTVEVAVVSLDLAEVYARQGLVAQLVGTVAETIPLFQSLGVGRELIAALLKLQEIARSQQAAVALLRDVAKQFQESLPQLAR
jgi:tetratricopeptide (TPR) repeat protein